MKPKNVSWGGGNQFLINLIKSLKNNNYSVNFKLSSKTDLVFFINSKSINRPGNNLTFNYGDFKKFKLKFPYVKCIQRINDTDKHRKSDYIDNNFKIINSLSDYTIFVSDWVFEYHANVWFNKNKSYKIINNDVDRDIFFPLSERRNFNNGVYKIVTHHFSSNINKGFDDYKALDEIIFTKKIKNVELHIIGNVPKNIEWKSAKLHGLMYGNKLANFLRQCHIYISGSRYEASAMHWKEGVACGLPLLYSINGGEIADYGAKYGLAFDGKNDMLSALNIIIKDYENYKKILYENQFQFKMISEYLKVIKHLIDE
tara:strand:- start:955 stop:1896 length:942 start_codon:yes stop_codon:yes gene_type:complete